MNSSTNSRPLPVECILKKLPKAAQYWVAYSGGLDSHVLLFLLSGVRDRLGHLGAVHVNHGIQAQAADWEKHCRMVCDELGVAFHALRVDGTAQPGESPEAAARSARYRALSRWLPADAVVMAAQHQDDQAETLLLQLFRGAGPKGLAAMPECMPLGGGVLVRPLLEYSRAQILKTARQHRLEWVEDPSNVDLRYRRNYVRQRLLPELQQHWPGLTGTLARAAAHQADQLELAQALGRADYVRCRASGTSLALAATADLSAARQRNLIRHWVEKSGLPVPSRSVLERIRSELLFSRLDANPRVCWQGAEARRYRDRMFVMEALPEHDPARRYRWKPGSVLNLEGAGGELSATRVRGQGLAGVESSLDIRFRQGGERLRPAGRKQRHSLKKLFQEWGVPDWERDRVPLIYVEERLAAVAGFCVCEGFQAKNQAEGQVLHWSRVSRWQ